MLRTARLQRHDGLSAAAWSVLLSRASPRQVHRCTPGPRRFHDSAAYREADCNKEAQQPVNMVMTLPAPGLWPALHHPRFSVLLTCLLCHLSHPQYKAVTPSFPNTQLFYCWLGFLCTRKSGLMIVDKKLCSWSSGTYSLTDSNDVGQRPPISAGGKSTHRWHS